ncbi:phosphate ABC transporter substrate-binding protein PstS [bacterium]|nr:phosphate ABC transporter substrate-binding protein PstS [bacterium]
MSGIGRTAVAAAVLLAAGCAGHEGRRLNAGGSTFVYPMMSMWAHEYYKAKDIEVNYQSIGSGGGIRQMTAQTFDFGCTDGPMNAEQLKKAASVNGEVVHVPLCMGAVVPAYNLPGVSEPLRFTGEVLADIYLGKVTKWNDPALAGLNPGISLPDQEIVVVRRSDGSGTTYVWVDYLSKVSPEWKTRVGVGTSVNWPVGIGQKGGEGVAGQVRRSVGSLGYIELTYALHNDIPFGLVRNREGAFVRADLKSVTAAAAGALTAIPDDLRYSITDPPGRDSYPVSGTVWAVVYVNQPPAKGRLIVDFLRWVIRDGQRFCAEMDYARLPEGLVERAERKLDLIQAGNRPDTAGDRNP